MNMLTDLKNRGIQDVCIVCCDGIKGLPDAITVTWLEADVQTCVVHLVRNTLRYVSRAHWGQITRELRGVCTAVNEETASREFGEFAEAWEGKYPVMGVM